MITHNLEIAKEAHRIIQIEDGKIKAKPDLPKAWKKMRFHICYRNKKYKIEIEDNNANIVEI